MEKLSQLTEILLKKYADDRLASVYLLKYSQNKSNPINWAKGFLLGLTKIEDHPDVLWIERDKKDSGNDKESEYRVDSKAIKLFLSSVQYRPTQLKKKFIFLSDAHLISAQVSNKLLKTLEELPDYVCLFLMAPQDENLLATIESRAIKILCPQNREANEATSWSKDSGPLDVVAAMKKSDNEELCEKSYIEHKIKIHLENPDYAQLTRLLDTLKHYDQSDKFNNSKNARLALLD